MSATVTLFDPTASTASDAAGVAVQQFLSGLSGKVVGFIDNAKPNFHILADELAELLLAKYGVARVVKHQKRAASVAAPRDVIERFAQECDLVIAGSGD